MINLSAPIVVASLAALPGLLLLVLWWRGRLALDDPYCGACGHSLRGATTMPTRCAECGKEFRRIGSVKFARRMRSLRVAIVGMMLLLLGPVLAFGVQRWQVSRAASAKAAQQAAAVAAASPGRGGPASSDQAILDQIAVVGNDPRRFAYWPEVTAQVTTGRLTAVQIETLIAAMERWNAAPPDGSPRDELPHLANQLGAALAVSPQVSPLQRERLLSNWFVPVAVSGKLRTSPGGRGVLGWGGIDGAWDDRPQPNAPVQLLRAGRLRELRIDGGIVVPTKDEQGRRIHLPALPPGDHAIELDFEWVVVIVPSESAESLVKDAGSSPIRADDRTSTGPFMRLFEEFGDLPEPEGRNPRRIANGVETVRKSLVSRGADQPLLDPLSGNTADQQGRVLSRARVDQAVVRPVGGPGQQTLQVRVVHAASGSANMLCRLMVKAGDLEFTSPPKLLSLRSRPVREGQQLEPIVLFEFNELIDALPRNVGQVQVYIEPVQNIPGLATEIDQGFGDRIDLGTVTLRRADLGE